MKVSNIKPNPNNPRTIKDANFEKLCKSITEFPKMMELRPIVIDAQGMVLGGNMRLKAIQHLGMKEVPDTWVKFADQLTPDEQRRFIIADNVSGGDWDIEDLAANWDKEELSEWGVVMPWDGMEQNNMTDEDVDLDEEFDPIGISANQQRVVFVFDGSEEAESYLNSLNVKFIKRNMAWQVNMTTQFISSVKEDTK